MPVSYDTNTATTAANRDYAVPSFLALRADQPFTAVSSGFVGTAERRSRPARRGAHPVAPYTDATDGNVEQTAGINLGDDGTFTLALGFGTTQAESVKVAGDSAALVRGPWCAATTSTWLQYDNGLREPLPRLHAARPHRRPDADRRCAPTTSRPTS